MQRPSLLPTTHHGITAGTTTATVLARAIFSEGAKSVAAGMNPMDLRRGINMAVEAAVEHLKSCSKRISTTEEISQVGTISANGEATIGALLAKAMERVGKEGVITVQVRGIVLATDGVWQLLALLIASCAMSVRSGSLLTPSSPCIHTYMCNEDHRAHTPSGWQDAGG